MWWRKNIEEKSHIRRVILLAKKPRSICQQGLSWNIAITDLKRKTVELFISIFVTVYEFWDSRTGSCCFQWWSGCIIQFINCASEGTSPVISYMRQCDLWDVILARNSSSWKSSLFLCLIEILRPNEPYNASQTGFIQFSLKDVPYLTHFDSLCQV